MGRKTPRSVKPIGGRSLPRISRKSIPLQGILHGGGEREILNRIRSYHRKARNVLEDWAKKTSLEIVGLAKRLGYAVAREDLKGLINSLRKIENKDHRTKLIILG